MPFRPAFGPAPGQHEVKGASHYDIDKFIDLEEFSVHGLPHRCLEPMLSRTSGSDWSWPAELLKVATADAFLYVSRVSVKGQGFTGTGRCLASNLLPG